MPISFPIAGFAAFSAMRSSGALRSRWSFPRKTTYGQYVFGQLLKLGVRIFEWPDKMLHAKAAAVDGIWATIGSYNLDARSLFHNLEVALCVIDREFAATVDAQILTDVEKSREIKLDEWKTRPF